MSQLPLDSPKKEKIVFFKDECDILMMIKNEETSKLIDYFKTNGYDKKILIRFIGYAINMVRPFSFKSMCLMDMGLVPNDVMKRIVHVILCEYQDNVSPQRLEYLILSATQIAEFLVEYNLLCSDDINGAIETYEEYDMDYLHDLIEFLKQNIGNKFTTSDEV